MMIPGVVDHLLILLIAAAYPVYASLVWHWRFRPRLQAGEPGTVVGFYRSATVELWLLAAVVLSWWFWKGRPAAGIGLGAPGGWAFWIGVIVVGGACPGTSGGESALQLRRGRRKQLGGSTR